VFGPRQKRQHEGAAHYTNGGERGRVDQVVTERQPAQQGIGCECNQCAEGENERAADGNPPTAENRVQFTTAAGMFTR
jgi:hypothetical protein